MAFNRKDYRAFAGTEIYFSKNDHRKMERARDNVTLVSTVCPDYPHDDGKYTFTGELGTGISLTAHSHLNRVPRLIEKLQEQGVEANWLILVADLPELTSKQTEFYTRVASSKDDYIARCESSAATIKAEAPQATEVKTFSSWYGKQGVPYLEMQEEVAERILREAKTNSSFAGKFSAFCAMRQNLAVKFRGRQLSSEELAEAAAHGMSLYVTHGSLLRQSLAQQKLVIVNHFTPNLQNFFLCNFVPGCEHLKNEPKFPLGVIDDSWY